jgi:hypothetical protein
MKAVKAIKKYLISLDKDSFDAVEAKIKEIICSGKSIQTLTINVDMDSIDSSETKFRYIKSLHRYYELQKFIVYTSTHSDTFTISISIY